MCNHMTTFEKKKYRIIGDTDSSRASEVERLYSLEPCAYSDDELRASVFRRMADFEAGNVDPIPHEQITRRTI